MESIFTNYREEKWLTMKKNYFDWKRKMIYDELVAELKHSIANGGDNKRIKKIQQRLDEMKKEGYVDKEVEIDGN